jgi:hypothetical protein
MRRVGATSFCVGLLVSLLAWGFERPAFAHCDPSSCAKMTADLAIGGVKIAYDLATSPKCSADYDQELIVAAALAALFNVPGSPINSNNCQGALQVLYGDAGLPDPVVEAINLVQQALPPGADVQAYLDCSCPIASAGVDAVKAAITDLKDCAAFNPSDCIGAAWDDVKAAACAVGGFFECNACPAQPPAPASVNCIDGTVAGPLTDLGNGTYYSTSDNQICSCPSPMVLNEESGSRTRVESCGTGQVFFDPVYKCACPNPNQVPTSDYGILGCGCPSGQTLMAGSQSALFSNMNSMSCGTCSDGITLGPFVGNGKVCLHCDPNQIAHIGDNQLYCFACGNHQVPSDDRTSCRSCGAIEVKSADGASCDVCVFPSMDGNSCMHPWDCTGDHQVLVAENSAGFVGYHCGCEQGYTPDSSGTCKQTLTCGDWQRANYDTNRCEDRTTCDAPGQHAVLTFKEGNLWTCQSCPNANSCVVDDACLACPSGTQVDNNNNCVPNIKQCPANTRPLVSVNGTSSKYGGASCLMFERSCQACADDEKSDGNTDCQKVVCTSGQTVRQHSCGPACEGDGQVFTIVQASQSSDAGRTRTEDKGATTGQGLGLCVQCGKDSIAVHHDPIGRNSTGICKTCPPGTHPDVRQIFCLDGNGKAVGVDTQFNFNMPTAVPVVPDRMRQPSTGVMKPESGQPPTVNVTPQAPSRKSGPAGGTVIMQPALCRSGQQMIRGRCQPTTAGSANPKINLPALPQHSPPPPRGGGAVMKPKTE